MHRICLATLCGVLGAIALAGCNALFDIQDHPLASGEGGATGPGDGGALTDASPGADGAAADGNEVGAPPVGDGAGADGGNGPADSAADGDATLTPDGTSLDGAPVDGPLAADAPKPFDAESFDATADGSIPDVVNETVVPCTGAFACVPGVPSGWEGPFELYMAATGSGAVPSCAGGFAGSTYHGNVDLSAAPATCDCSCGGPTDVTCSAPTVSFYGTNSLLGSPSCTSANYCGDVTFTPGECTAVDVASLCNTTYALMTAGASTATGGSCAPDASTSKPPYTWGTDVAACASTTTTQGECASGSVCAPVPAAPFQSTLCISKAGSVACPGTGYTVGTESYASATDGRGCTSCTCALSGVTCAASLLAALESTPCSVSTGTLFALPFDCDPGEAPGDYALDVTASGGNCAPSTSTPTGTAAPAGATTFCCLPTGE